MQLFQTMTLKSQLTIGFSLMVAIIALVVFINIAQVRYALELSQSITNIHTPTAKNSMLMLNGVNHALAALRGWMLLGQDKYKKDVWLSKPENRQKHRDYCRESHIRRQNYNSFEAGVTCKEC